MAPEALRGDPVDVRADIWSFGAVLYRCLSGRPPVELVPIDELVEIDADLASTVHRALHPEPDHRFASMSEVVGALRRHPRRE
jgi:serine/threonine-protein kinase